MKILLTLVGMGIYGVVEVHGYDKDSQTMKFLFAWKQSGHVILGNLTVNFHRSAPVRPQKSSDNQDTEYCTGKATLS